MGAKLEQEDVTQFIRQYADSPLKLELLILWSRHPNARFGEGVITGALRRSRRLEIREALNSLAEAGFVTQEACKSGERSLYSLTKENSMRLPVVSLSGYSWDEIRGRLYSSQREVGRRAQQ